PCLHPGLYAPRRRRLDLEYDRPGQWVRALAKHIHKYARPPQVAHLVVIIPEVKFVTRGDDAALLGIDPPGLLVDLLEPERRPLLVAGRKFLDVAPGVLNGVCPRGPCRHRNIN